MLCVVAKLYERGLMKRMKDSTDGVIVDKQCGFRSGKGRVHQIYARNK